MKRLTNILSIFILSGCINGYNQNSKCPIVVGSHGAQLVVSFESAKKLCNNQIKYVVIEPVSKSPATAQDLYKNVFEATKNDSMILVSKASYKYYSAPDGGFKFLMFKGIGVNSYWLGLDEYKGKFYTLKKDSTLQIVGFQEQMYRTTPDGIKILMTKGSGVNDFFVGSSNDKIYKAKGDDGTEQIGVFSFFWLPVLEGSKLHRSILMTKSMKVGDKWCGELDGVIYIQK